MIEPPQVPGDCRVIPLWRNISGDNFHPVHEIVDYTVVDEIDFDRLNKHCWFMWEDSRSGDRYAVRHEWQGRKMINISMAREILNLSRGAGWGGIKADHIDHNTLNNRRKNLRKATPSQNGVNIRWHSSSQRFKCVNPHGSKYQAYIRINGLRVWFTAVPKEVEAALMYNYGADLVYGEFAKLNIIPEDEMPSYERQWELYDIVVVKLREKGFPCDNALIREDFQ